MQHACKSNVWHPWYVVWSNQKLEHLSYTMKHLKLVYEVKTRTTLTGLVGRVVVHLWFKVTIHCQNLFQSRVKSYQRFLKWYLIPPCLLLSNIKYISRVKCSYRGKVVAPSLTSRCSNYWKGTLPVTNLLTDMVSRVVLLKSFVNNHSFTDWLILMAYQVI